MSSPPPAATTWARSGPSAGREDGTKRDIDLGLDGCQALRFPAWLVRANPGYVAGKILEALRRAGYPG
jgi:hypothetical protein